MTDDDLQVLRQRYDGFWAAADRLQVPNPTTTARVLCRTTSQGSYPTATGRYFLVNPLEVTGAESEGGSATLTPDMSNTFAVLVTRGVPTLGSNLVARSIGGRWVAEIKAASVSCGGVLTVTVTCIFGPFTTPISGATVTITQGPTTFTATTNSLGQAVFSPGASGTWNVTATKTNYTTYTGTVVFSCINGSKSATTAPSTGVISGRISGCNGVSLPGVALEVRNSTGTTVLATGTTTSATSGDNYSISFPTGGALSFRLYQSRSKFTGGFTSFTLNCSGVVTLTGSMTPTNDYTCQNGCTTASYEPAYKVLSSSSWLGSVTLNLTTIGGFQWQGSATITRNVYVGGVIGTTSSADVTVTAIYASAAVTFFANTLNSSIATIVSDAYAAANPGLVASRGVSVTTGGSCTYPPLFFTGTAPDPFSGGSASVTVTE